MTEDELIQAIKWHLAQPPRQFEERLSPSAPITPGEMEIFEQRIEHPIPQLFKRLYMEIGDGDWGPWGGLCNLGVRGEEYRAHFTVLEAYDCEKYDDENGQDPNFYRDPDTNERLLYFCYGGCTVYSVLGLETGHVGLRDAESPIEWQTASLQEWLERWLNGEQLMAFASSKLRENRPLKA